MEALFRRLVGAILSGHLLHLFRVPHPSNNLPNPTNLTSRRLPTLPLVPNIIVKLRDRQQCVIGQK